ncbi:type IV secretion protein Rhs, partial [Photorhabdus heterorhabditis]
PANNKLRMDDERGKEHIKLSTEYGGKSQLNLGHLVDGQRPHPDKRGEGFELRTDDWGAIRAGKGLFISTDEQLKAQGKTLEMQAALSALSQASQQMQTLSEAATQAASLAADVQTQLRYVQERVTQLQTAVLLASSPAGISLVSGAHIQMAAKENLMVNVGKHADIGVMKRLFIGVGEAFGLFVQKLGIKLVANQGKVLIQAQHDEVVLMAQQEITLSSDDNNITITTPKTLTLNAGGTYLKMDGSGIEFGTLGHYQVKCQSYNVKKGGASIDTKVSTFPQTELKETTPDHTGSISG